jgi:phage terminase large subunit-like protein
VPARAGQAKADAGKHKERDNFIPPPSPHREPPPIVDEVAPYIATYDQPKPADAYFDEEAANHAVDWIESRIVFYEGPFAGHPFKMQHWQRRIVREVFGWKRADGTRLIRMVYIEVPRKNGKSTFAAALALYLAYADGEPAPQVYFAAADREQASIAYNIARTFLQQDPDMASDAIIYNSNKRILFPEQHGEIRALSSDTKKLYGLNLHGLVFDELMAQPNRTMWDALTTAQGAREQPLIIAITTAGWDRNSVAFEQREYARQVAGGTFEDPTFLGVIYSCDEDADWTDPDVWRSATPALGATVDLDYYAKKCNQAQGQPSAQNAFRTLLLCQWVGQTNRVIPMADWDACPDDDGDTTGAAFGGMDLSSTTDLTAIALDFPQPDGSHLWLRRIFMPSDNLRERGLKDRAPYETWADQGLIELTPGNVIDYAYIRAAWRDWAEQYDIRDIGYDRWNSSQLVRELEEDGFLMVKVGQGHVGMNAAAKEVCRLAADHKLLTRGDPVLRWMADNAEGVFDPAGNLKFDKRRSAARIDGLVAGTMALDGAMRRNVAKRVSVYNQRGPDDIWQDLEEALSG